MDRVLAGVHGGEVEGRVLLLVGLVYLGAQGNEPSDEFNLVLNGGVPYEKILNLKSLINGGVHEQAVPGAWVAAGVDQAFLNQLVGQHVLDLERIVYKLNILIFDSSISRGFSDFLDD